MSGQKPKDRPYMDAFGKATQISVTLLANIFVGFLLGHFLDSLLGTAPWITIVMMFLGIISGFWSMYKLAAGKGEKD